MNKVFGPVPSRRLGRSLGINNIPPKICSYNCVYCQVGRTSDLSPERKPFYPPEELFAEVRTRLKTLRDAGEPVDALTFAPDGEPTLDENFGRAVDLLKTLGVKVAVLTNASLLFREDVRNELARADWVCLKVDTVDEKLWRRVNRPAPAVTLSSLLDGMRAFSKIYRGELVTDSMLLAGYNDDPPGVRKLAGFLRELKPKKAYLSVPTRPPAEQSVKTPSTAAVENACRLFQEALGPAAECPGHEEDSPLAYTGDVERDVLDMAAVHPVREDQLRGYLERAGKDWDLIVRLLDAGQLLEKTHDGKKFYLKKLPRVS
ncbi:MAG TPA: radical SAM protein [Elusimicrobiota bacterium]|nr:radical SAM protein [Elusimicrobiota bacterium]